MLFIYLSETNFLVLLFCIAVMNLSNFVHYSKILAFEKFKRRLCKYYPSFVKTYRNESNSLTNKFVTNEFFVLFYDCIQNLKHFLSICKLS